MYKTTAQLVINHILNKVRKTTRLLMCCNYSLIIQINNRKYMYLVKRANGNPQRFSGKPMGDLAYPGVISGKIC